MAQPNFTFEQALPYLRRGFIMRAHGTQEWDKIELREENGKLEYARGDGNWQSAADVPLMDMNYDVYDQKRIQEDAVARAEPIVPFSERQKVRIKNGNELVTVTGIFGRRVRVEHDGGQVEFYDPEQLKEDEYSDVGGGNNPAQIDPSTNASAISGAATGGVLNDGDPSRRAAPDGAGFGINAGQVEQQRNGPIENTDEHRVEPSADHSHNAVEPDGIPEDASVMTEAGDESDADREPAGTDNESEGGVNPDEGGKKKRKGKYW